jgi:putative tricarboxylic transport membrane protein
MMDSLGELAAGFGVAVTAGNLLASFTGVLLGTVVGILPGVGPISAIALLLPATFGLPPATALIMLAGVYYGAQYGGSTSAILLNLPGEASSAVTCIDGYAMARQGRAGVALTTAAIGSFVGGCAGTAAIAVFSPALTRIALSFGPAEYVALMACGMVAGAALSGSRLLEGAAMVALGILAGLVGADLTQGVERFTFGIPQLSDGINFAVVAIGAFGIAEVMDAFNRPAHRKAVPSEPHMLVPRGAERRAAASAVARGTLIGSVLGVLPGGGAIISSFGAYAVEKRLARDPWRFGHGAIEGVAAPESANNAAAQTAFIPLLMLGVPANAVMGLMLGAMTIHGVVPGPDLATTRPDVFWGVVVAMAIGNVMLLVLNLPLVGLWVRVLAIPDRLLYPSILLMACIGVYSVNHSTFDLMLAGVFGIVGFIMMRLDLDRTSFLLGFILGPLLEENLRRALTFSGGDPTVFFRRPASLVILLIGCLLAVGGSPLGSPLVMRQLRRLTGATEVSPH